jgi:hypothetical protein
MNASTKPAPFSPREQTNDLILRHPPPFLLRRDRGRSQWDSENYSDAGTKKGGGTHYDVMSLADIKALPVGHLARQDAILLLWSTGAMLPQTLEVLPPGARNTCQGSSGGR